MKHFMSEPDESINVCVCLSFSIFEKIKNCNIAYLLMVLSIHDMYQTNPFNVFAILTHCIFLFLQVCADDVLTKEEQIGLLFRARQKCEGNIKAKNRIPGEQTK